MRTYVLIAALLLVSALSLANVSCTRNLTVESITGEYSVSGEWGSSKLLLQDNGAFIQDISPYSGHPLHLEGKWEMTTSSNKSTLYGSSVQFRPFLSMWTTNLGELVSSAICTIEPIGRKGIWIVVDNDAGTSYKRQ